VSLESERAVVNVIGQLLPLAIGIAISPVPIIAVILMLLGPRAALTSTGFLIGWLAGIVVVTVIFILIASAAGLDSDDESSTATAWIKVGLGVLLLLVAVGQWRRRPRPGDTPKLPKWMTAIDSITPLKATGLGSLLSGVNPKNLTLCAAAGVALATAGLDTSDAVIAILVFTLLAASTVAVPVVAYAVAASRLRGTLDELRGWLLQNNATVMSVLLLVMGVVLISKGIEGLG
jgi:threonine/homoserine/homoserine lactone efflux protein